MGKKILVVDDDPAIRYSLERILTSKGYEVEQAVSGQACLGILAERGEEFCLVLLDIMMPGLSGWDVTAQVLNDKSLRHMPIVYLTAKTDELSKMAGGLSGEEYLTKPFDNEDLVKKIARVLDNVRKNERKSFGSG